MEASELRRIQDFIWNIADDVLRDIYSRAKYRDVILPMPLRSIEEIRDEILELEGRTERLLKKIVGAGA